MSETTRAPLSATQASGPARRITEDAPPFLVERSVADVEKEMRPGDIVAFGGTDLVSRLTRFLTRSRVSHVAIVGSRSADSGCTLVESVWKGVRRRCAKTRIERAPAEVWWLPLSDYSRSRLDNDAFATFLNSVHGRKFDLRQPLAAMLDKVVNGRDLFWAEEDLEKLFCSELAAAALARSGVIPGLNPSEVSPVDVCRWRIYRGNCVQLRGKRQHIRGYNSELPMSSRYEKHPTRTPPLSVPQ